MDSATSFLFNRCVDSLHSSLPYPFNAPPQYQSLPLSPADKFARAFTEAQGAVSTRARHNWVWPWYEIFGSSTNGPMSVIDGYVRPILDDAVNRARTRGFEKEKGIRDNECLLDYLVRHTQGEKNRYFRHSRCLTPSTRSYDFT